jgi:hypothetical protein
MKSFVSACATILFLVAIGCDGGTGGGTGGTGGEGASGGSATTGGNGGAMGGNGGAMGGAGGGTGGAMTTGGSGGAGGAMGGAGGSSAGAFAEPCAIDADCEMGLMCYNFNAKGMLCTKECMTDQDCPMPPSSGCNMMGVCKPD